MKTPRSTVRSKPQRASIYADLKAIQPTLKRLILRGSYVLDGDIGHDTKKPRFSEENEFVPKAALCPFPREVFTLNLTKRETLKVQAGVTVVIGATGAGKTTLIEHIKRHASLSQQVEVVEFLENSDTALTDEAEFFETILESTSDVFIGDSLRYIAYAPSDATGEGGFNTEIFMLMSRWNQLCKMINRSIIFTINPLQEEEDEVMSEKKIWPLARKFAGSSTAVIFLTSFGMASVSSYATTRNWVSTPLNFDPLEQNSGQSTPDPSTTYSSVINATVVADDGQLEVYSVNRNQLTI